MKKFSDEKIITLFQSTDLLSGMPQDFYSELLAGSNQLFFSKGEFLTRIGEKSSDVFFVISGLVRVNICSANGKQITLLLLKEGEPYNLLGAYLDYCRNLEASAATDSYCLKLKGAVYTALIEKYPFIIKKLLNRVGKGFDSASERLLELVESDVETRILRVLSSLCKRFGSPMLFTSVEISEIAGTTPESTLRTISRLREIGAIETQRGKIWVKDINLLNSRGFGNLIV